MHKKREYYTLELAWSSFDLRLYICNTILDSVSTLLRPILHEHVNIKFFKIGEELRKLQSKMLFRSIQRTI